MRFVPRGQGDEVWADLRARRFLCAAVPQLSPGGVAGAGAAVPEGGRGRGGLRAAIDDAVELALALRGALPPRVDADAAIGAVIEDQIFRALALGAAGVAIALPPLHGLAGVDGALSAADSAALGAWMAAAREAPVALLFAEADRAVRVLTPVSLAELAADAAPPAESGTGPARHAVAAAELVASDLADALGGAAIRVDIDLGERGEIEVSVAAPVTAPAPVTESAPASAPASAPVSAPASAPFDLATAPTDPPPPAFTLDAAPTDPPPPPALPDLAPQEPRPAPADARREGRPRGVLLPRSRTRRPEPEATAAPPAPPADALDTPATPTAPIATPRLDAPRAPRILAAAPPAAAAPLPAAAPAAPEPAALAEDAAPPRRAPQPPARVVSAAEWRSLALELDEARGPRPVRVVEQLFTTHYMPLLGAAQCGEADVTVQRVVETWRSSFERSYRESFSALRVTGKRPPMVLDAPDIAARLARLNGARAVKLVLVDAMRFDLGERVAARLKEATEGRAVLVERSLLWAALPTTTAAQLALLARGPDGLREAAPAAEQEPAIARGRAVTMLRRERAGRCELMKLDLVEARLRNAGPPLPERLEGIAEEVTEVVARFMEGLPPRTLVMVFGDHGFRISGMADGLTTGPASQGGASPEEVLVPAQAWLVGGVH